tara:strand:- start:1086 stop:1331 length:246 start_codon:yes stop_codon:yes gene_type:complete
MLKLKGNLVNTVHTTAANIGSASAVYIFADNAATITIAGSGSPFAGTFKMAANTSATVVKQPSDTVAATAQVSVTAIAHHY